MAFGLQNRNKSILERKFIDRILEQEGANIITEQNRIDKKFSFKSTGLNRRFSVNNGQLNLEHGIIQRFRDLNRIRGRKQVSSKQHNRVIFSHFNTIQRGLMFGFTKAIRAQLKAEYKIEVNG